MNQADINATLIKQAEALLKGEKDLIANCANFSALIFNSFDRLNWAGFYFVKGDELVLGPFQGRPACVRLKKPRGVCWAAVLKKETVVIDDVHNFPGHIACDAASVSEIVVPLVKNGEVFAVFDIDSPVKARFTQKDKTELEALCQTFLSSVSPK